MLRTLLTRVVSVERFQVVFCFGNKISGTTTKSLRYSQDQCEVGHMPAALDLAPMRPLDPNPATSLFLRFRPAKTNSRNDRAKGFGRLWIERPCPFGPTGPFRTLPHGRERRLWLEIQTG